MNPNPYPGFFLDIEGLDGCGATTQVDILEKTLRKRGINVYTTKEPTDNVVGGLIRGVLTGVYKLPAEALQLLFVADRSHHLARQIVPILKNHHLLITDRFCWSTIAFGSVNLSKQWLLELHHYCPLPDLSIFLRVSPKVCLKRLKADRFDFELFEKEKTMQRVWEAYEWLAKKFPESIKIIDGEKTPEAVAKDIWQLLKGQPKFCRLTG